jgi:hypothetical protein
MELTFCNDSRLWGPRSASSSNPVLRQRVTTAATKPARSGYDTAHEPDRHDNAGGKRLH